MRRLFVTLVCTMGLAFLGSIAFADYVIVKKANGRCKVVKGTESTENRIGDIYKTRKEAWKAKKELCPPKSSKPSKLLNEK
jgi:hypothetical protein